MKKKGQAGKVISFILCTVSAILIVIQIGAVLAMEEEGVYHDSKQTLREVEAEHYALAAADDIVMVMQNYEKPEDAAEEIETWYRDTNFNYYVISEGNQITDIENGESGSRYCLEIEHHDGYYVYNGMRYEDGSNADYKLTICLLDELVYKDAVYTAYKLLDIAYAIRYWILAALAVSLIVLVASFVWLIKHTGRKDEDGNIVLRRVDKIPFDLYTLLMLAVSMMVVLTLVEAACYAYDSCDAALYTVAASALEIPLVLWFIMSCIVRHKAGMLWKNTCIHRIGCRIKSGFQYVRTHMPFIWKGVLLAGGICIVELLLLAVGTGMYGFGYMRGLLFLFFLEKAVLITAFTFVLANLNQLKKAGEQIAAGDYNHEVDTSKMFWDFKQYGYTLNHITEGMQTALEERMKSEHFKTELITNVSHDIKTPLTSIINYTDLLSKEDLDNPKAAEYLEVLIRQSARLKKLIEDLIEASKASAGTLKVNWENCEPEVLLTQAAGEYEERLRSKNLELIVHISEEGLTIRADGRHLWRVFDNLLNNIYKYAQPGTRVYLDMERKDGRAVILFRNTSGCALHMSGDELRERFVRGDSSRNTEGSGLGLSIAESLTELMGGTLDLIIDGDLFKVILTFPCQIKANLLQDVEVSLT